MRALRSTSSPSCECPLEEGALAVAVAVLPGAARRRCSSALALRRIGSVFSCRCNAFEAWRSVAIEGKRKACTSLLATVPAACRALAQGGEIIVCGYPEFVCAIAQRYEASALGQQQRRALLEASFSLKAARQDGDASSSAAAAGPNRAAVNRAETERCAPCTPPGEEGCAVS